MPSELNFWGFRSQKKDTLEDPKYDFSHLVWEAQDRISDVKISTPALLIKISGLLYALLGENYNERVVALGISGLAMVYILCAYKVAEAKRTQILEILHRKKGNRELKDYLRKPLDPA